MVAPTSHLRKRKRQSNRKHKEVLFGTNYRMPCHYCGCPLTFDEATIDHMHSFADGGYDSIHNKVIACKDCNQRKGKLGYAAFMKLLEQERATHAQKAYLWRKERLIAHRVKKLDS